MKPGDTATGLAVRFHAWTAELISHNHLGSTATLRVGQRIRIPVVRAAARRDREIGYVTVAAELSDADLDRLAAALRRIYGREIALKVSVDPRVLGGMSVQVGSDLYDGTILRRINETRTALSRR